MKNRSSNSLNGFLFLLSIILLASCSEPGYYVSSNGSDENPGTKSKPFKTIAKVNTLPLKAGDKIFFRGGESFEGTLSLTVNGTEKDSIVIGSYDEGNAIIHGGNNEAVVLRGSYFVLHDLDTKGSGRKTGNTKNGIRLVDASNAKVENINTEGFQKSGLELFNCKNIDVKKVYAFNNGFAGINVAANPSKRCKNILIKDCKAENNPGDPTGLDNHSGNGILVSRVDSVTIDHCIATNNGWDMPRQGNGPVGIWAYEASYVTIQYCISYANKSSKGGLDGGGFDLDGGIRHSVIQYCLSYDNAGAGYGLFQYYGASLWYDNIVRYCISINDANTTEGSGGIFTWNGSMDSVQLADCAIYNNFIYNTKAPAIQFENSSLHKNFKFVNNIIIGSGEIVHGPSSGEKFINNVWWNAEGSTIKFRGYDNLVSWANATQQEKLNGVIRGKQIDPMLKGPFVTNITDPYKLETLIGYTLKPESPLKNSGLKIDSLKAERDFYGTRVPEGDALEVGVCEWREN